MVITFTSLIVGFLLNVFSPEAAGSGIPQVKTAYWKELGYMKFKPVLVKFIAGVLSIGGGNSLGREGPSVYLGSGVSSNLFGVLGASSRQRRNATLIGSSAGLAAAFNTPIAAITFVIEEIVGDLNNRYLGSVVLSAVIGAFVVYAILGRHPAFSIPSTENISWLHYIVVPGVSLIAAFVGIIFQRSTIFWRGRLKKQTKIPGWLLPLCGGLIAWIIGCSTFWATGKIGVFGLGYQDLSNALNNNFEWRIAGVLVCAKLCATIACYSFGGCGGIFAPSLFIGGLSGYFIGGLANIVMPLTGADRIVLAAVGMSSCLGAIVRAPFTSVLIVFEMTHQFTLIPGLLIGTIISQAIAYRAGKLNFYDALLVQDGHELYKIRPPIDLHGWQNLPVCAIANPNLVGINNFNEKEMREIIDRYPYNAFPVISDNEVQGIVTRQDIEKALCYGNRPNIHLADICYSDQTIKEVGDKFIDSTVPVLIVIERNTNAIKGVITLHDLIRAQAAIQN
ncbi:MAG: chloride channel protein [Smithella sp.]